MERAGKLLGQSKLAARCLTAEQMAIASWKAAVGKKIAAHTTPVSLVRGRLIIEVGDSVWQKQLFVLRSQIVSRIASIIGPGVVSEVEFRVLPPRRRPAREEVVVRESPAPNPERVEDPVLNRIYRAAKRRESKRATG